MRAYGNNSLQELLNISPNEGVGDFFSQEEIRKIRHLWPLFKVTLKQQAQVFLSPHWNFINTSSSPHIMKNIFLLCGLCFSFFFALVFQQHQLNASSPF